MEQRLEYLHPGILVNRAGKWEGSDHLFNLTENIAIYITIIKPESVGLNITSAELQKEVEEIFASVQIKAKTLIEADKPPLPAFEIEIFIYPIDKQGFVAFCEGRLFESVILHRFQMDPNMAFQAITWEKQILLITPTIELKNKITNSVRDIANVFAERYRKSTVKEKEQISQ